MRMKELMLKILDVLGLAYWLEIITNKPKCTYYFGPFISKREAEMDKIGFLDDLRSEGAQDIKVALKRCKPDALTIFDEGEEPSIQGIPRLSRQAL